MLISHLVCVVCHDIKNEMISHAAFAFDKMVVLPAVI